MKEMEKTTTVTQQDLYFKVHQVIQSAKQTLHKLKTYAVLLYQAMKDQCLGW